MFRVSLRDLPGCTLLAYAWLCVSTAIAQEKSVEDLAAEAQKSVVVVSFTGRSGERVGLGTGFVIDADGLIATNLHVIGEARPISVKFKSGKTYQVKSVHATDRQRDLAILKIEAKNLPALPLGDADTLKQGQQVVALGNPLGLQYSVVSGVVSGRREIEGRNMLQLAIPIERGNSGGPLLDLQGRVHGILTMKSLVTRNLGFAVSVNDLKPLIEKPNPIPMSRWLTIGRLNPKLWTTRNGARWRQRAGRIQVSERGTGFGGRSLCLSKTDPPKMPYELAVWVKLDDEAGAAGLVFHADGSDKHYGFYPSAGGVRMSRFDGPDVFSWNVLVQTTTRHYRPGEWNHLKVKVALNSLQCYVNDHLVIESKDAQYIEGQVGLAKFRETKAEFKGFQVGTKLPSSQPAADVVARINNMVANLPAKQPPTAKLTEQLLNDANATTQVLRNRAAELEQQAERLRQLARSVHEKKVQTKLASLLKADEEEIDLLHAALLLAWLDNEDLDVAGYLQDVEQIATDIREKLPQEANEGARLKALHQILFEELGYHGSRTNYYSSSNSYLNEVIDDREGLPITLSVLYIELARRLDLQVVGVGLPGHFVVRHQPKTGETQLVDVFERGKFLSRQDAIKTVEDSGRTFDEEHLKAYTKKEILTRMLTNLMNVAQNEEDVEAMLRYVETTLVILPDDPQQRWFRAVLRFQTERLTDALTDIEWLLQNPHPAIEKERVQQLQTIIENQMMRNE